MTGKKEVEFQIVSSLLRNNTDRDKLIREYPYLEKEINRAHNVIHSIYGNGIRFRIEQIRSENKQTIEKLVLTYEYKDMKILNSDNTFGENILKTIEINKISFDYLENIYEQIIKTYNEINDRRELNRGFLNSYAVQMRTYWNGFESEEALIDINYMKHNLAKFKTYESKRKIVTVYMFDKANWNKKTVDNIASALPKDIEDSIMNMKDITLYKLKKLDKINVFAIANSAGSMFDVSLYFEDRSVLGNLKYTNKYGFQIAEKD